MATDSQPLLREEPRATMPKPQWLYPPKSPWNPSERFINTANSIAEKAVKPQEPFHILNLHSSLFQKTRPKTDCSSGKLNCSSEPLHNQRRDTKMPQEGTETTQMKALLWISPWRHICVCWAQGGAAAWVMDIICSCLQPSAPKRETTNTCNTVSYNPIKFIFFLQLSLRRL